MRNIVFLFVFGVITLILFTGCNGSAPSADEAACLAAGGTVESMMCCKTASDFPDTCLIGACGCSEENSHTVKVCSCPNETCWRAHGCAAAEAEEICFAASGEGMALSEARTLAEKNSECRGSLTENSSCNPDTATWWIDLSTEKDGCAPACVVDMRDKTAEVNWRCTGLVVEDENVSGVLQSVGEEPEGE